MSDRPEPSALLFSLALESHRLDEERLACACGNPIRYYDDHELMLNQHEGHLGHVLAEVASRL